MAEILLGPFLTGHFVTHESAVLESPLDISHAGTMKEMQELVTELLIKERGVLEVDRSIASCKLAFRKDEVLGFFFKSPQHRVYPLDGEDMEVIFVPREEWSNHRSSGILLIDFEKWWMWAGRMPNSWDTCRF